MSENPRETPTLPMPDPDALDRLYRASLAATTDYASAVPFSQDQKRRQQCAVERAHEWETAITAAWPQLVATLRGMVPQSDAERLAAGMMGDAGAADGDVEAVYETLVSRFSDEHPFNGETR